jgi:nucleoid-associated protein YgaU
MASRYDNSVTLKTLQGKPYYDSKRYPNIPLSENDLYVVTGIGDRLDNLAYRYFGSGEYWWVIAIANDIDWFFELTPGQALKIPTDVNDILRYF